MKNYYQTLGLLPNASPRKIKEQYRTLAKIYHPDRVNDPSTKLQYAEKFREINQAYEALSNVVKRATLNPKQRKLNFLYQHGQQLFEDKKWSQAMVVFNEILMTDSNYRDVPTRLQEARRKHKRIATQYAEAETLFKHKQWNEAVKVLEMVLKEDAGYRDAAQKYKKARREQLMSDFMKQY